jgi:hypothetical protein
MSVSSTGTEDVVTDLMNRFLMSDRFKVSRLKSSRQSGQELTPEETDNMLTDPDIDPTSLVWAVMSDLRGRTVNEVFAIVEKRQGLERKKVETILNSLVNSGEMIKAVVTNTVIYTLKGSKMQQTTSRAPTGNNNTVQQNSQQNDTNEWNIDPLDSIDLAVWKLMSDGKQRTISAVSEALGDLGFNKALVHSRFVQILHKNHYEAKGNSTPKSYVLRRGVKAPGETKSSKLATSVVEEQETEPVVKATLPSSGKEVTLRTSPDFNKMLADALGKPAIKELQMTDTLDQCIWKVTHDREWYTVKDLDMLLEAHGFRQGMIGNRVGQLFRNPDTKWFEREKLMNGTNAYKYRMKSGVAYPASPVVDQETMLNDMTEEELPPVGEKILAVLKDNPKKDFSPTGMQLHLESLGYDVVSATVVRVFNELRDAGLVGHDPVKNFWFLAEDVPDDTDEVEIGTKEATMKVIAEVPAPMLPKLTEHQQAAIDAIKEATLKSPDEHVPPMKGKTMVDLLAATRRLDASNKVDQAIARAKESVASTVEEDDELMIEQVTMIKGVPFSTKELKALVEHLGTTLRAIGGGEAETETSHGGLTFTTRVVSEVSFSVKGIDLNRVQAVQIINRFGNL